MVAEASMAPAGAQPLARETLPPPGQVVRNEPTAGVRGKVQSFFKKTEVASPVPVKSPDGVLGVLTDDPKEVANVLDYAKAKDSREAAFAAKDKHVAWDKAMQEPLNDQNLAQAYLEAVIDRESRANGGTGNSIDRTYAQRRIHESYRAKAKNSPEVVAAVATGNQAEIDDAINRVVNNTLIQEAKAELAAKIESQGSATDGLSELAGNIKLTDPSGKSYEVIESNNVGVRLRLPDGQIQYMARGEFDAKVSDGSLKSTLPQIAGGSQEATAPEPATAEVVDQAAQAVESPSQQAVLPLSVDEQKELRDLREVMIPDESQRARRDELATREKAIVNNGQVADVVPAIVEPVVPVPEPSIPITEAEASPQDKLKTAEAARDEAQKALNDYSGNDLNEYKALTQRYISANSNYVDLLRGSTGDEVAAKPNVQGDASVSEGGSGTVQPPKQEGQPEIAQDAGESKPEGAGAEAPAAGVEELRSEIDSLRSLVESSNEALRQATEALNQATERIGGLEEANRKMAKTLQEVVDWQQETDPVKKEEKYKNLLIALGVIIAMVAVDAVKQSV